MKYVWRFRKKHIFSEEFICSHFFRNFLEVYSKLYDLSGILSKSYWIKINTNFSTGKLHKLSFLFIHSFDEFDEHLDRLEKLLIPLIFFNNLRKYFVLFFSEHHTFLYLHCNRTVSFMIFSPKKKYFHEWRALNLLHLHTVHIVVTGCPKQNVVNS